jgi:hypothetical protein
MTEIFQNRGLRPKETIGMPKEKVKVKVRKLTPQEKKYVLNYTPLGEIIVDLEKNADPDLVRIKRTRTGTPSIETLYNYKIINKKYGLVKINYENLVNLWEETKGAKIIKFFVKDQKELTVRQISKLLKSSFDNTNDEIYKMENSGLLEARMIGKKTRVFHSPEHCENTIWRRLERLIPEKEGLTDVEICKAFDIKNKWELIETIKFMKEPDSIIYTDKLPSDTHTIHFFSKKQIGDEKDPEKVKEIMMNLIKERRKREFDELKAQKYKTMS